jgi:hypothetical protein
MLKPEVFSVLAVERYEAEFGASASARIQNPFAERRRALSTTTHLLSSSPIFPIPILDHYSSLPK